MSKENKGGEKVKKKRGNPNIANYGTRFSSTHQPPRYRQGTKWLTDMLINDLHSDKVVKISGRDIITGKETVIEVNAPTKDVLVNTLLRLAAGGNMKALEMIFDRIEGRVESTRQDGDDSMGDQRMRERVVVLADGTRVPLL